MSKFELKVAKDGKFFFILTGNPPHANLLSSDRFGSKELALHNIDRVKRNAVVDDSYEKKTSNINRLFFVLLGDDRQIIGTSARFDSEADRDSAMAELRRSAPEAPIDDQTAS